MLQRLTFPQRDHDGQPVARPHRSAEQIVRNDNPPLVPGADPGGFHLETLDWNDCRFPIGRDSQGHLFCAEPVDDCRPGRSLGSYCRFHRDYLRREPSVWDEGRVG